MSFDCRVLKVPAVKYPARDGLASALGRYDRLIEVGVGDRLDVAKALAAAGCDVVAIDIDVDVDVDADAGARIGDVDTDVNTDTDTDTDTDADTTPPEPPAPPDVNTPNVCVADVTALATDSDPLASLRTRCVSAVPPAIDAVYARRLPAALQRPTARLAARLGADCVFTTLGFEAPVVSVTPHTLRETTLYRVCEPGGTQE